MRQQLRPRRLAWLITAVLMAELAVGSCGRDGGSFTGPPPNQPPTDHSDVIVTEPVEVDLAALPPRQVSPAGPGGAFSFGAGGMEEVSFISYAPGSAAEADSIEVRNVTRDLRVGAPMVDGGVDPIAIPASVGDSLEIAVFRQGVLFEMKTRTVPDRTPPRVVRTYPPRGRTRVPLNAMIILSFSEPMDSLTMRPDVIQLLQNGQPVPGTVWLEPTGLVARFNPATELMPNMTYKLVVTTDAADLNGDGLEQAEEVSFTTGTELIPVASITVTAIPALLRGQTQILISANPRDDSGSPVLPDAPVVWSSSDPTVATVDSVRQDATVAAAAWLTARGLGTAQVVATIGGVADTASVTVSTFPRFASVTSGDEVSCALDFSGQAYCWGRYQPGWASARVPRPYGTGELFASLALGNDQRCGILASDNQNAGCWGVFLDPPWVLILRIIAPLNGQSGSQRSYTFIEAGGRSSTGFGHTCAIEVGGAAYCWGNNQEGQLGDGYQYGSSAFSNQGADTLIIDIQPVAVTGGLSFERLSPGGDHTCGLTTGGQAYCWGYNATGQLGFAALGGSLTPGLVSGGLTFQALDAGLDHTCALALGGSAFCWGDNGSGQLGSTGTGATSTPTLVQGGLTFTTLSTGARHTCAITSNGKAYCWGDNHSGQLGNGTTLVSSAPVLVQGGLTFMSVSAAGDHTCGMTTLGLAYCWGENSQGQLGDDTYSDRLTPVMVVGQP
jgi:uncharacterized protein YjdB